MALDVLDILEVDGIEYRAPLPGDPDSPVYTRPMFQVLPFHSFPEIQCSTCTVTASRAVQGATWSSIMGEPVSDDRVADYWEENGDY